MKNRIYIKDLNTKIGDPSNTSGQAEIIIAGWVNARRDQGKMVFFDMRDMTGTVQCVALPMHIEVIEEAKKIRPEWVLKITGLVNKRPEKNINVDILNGDVEMEVLKIEVLAEAETLPFDINSDLNIDTLLDYRPLTLRSKKEEAIFKVQNIILNSFREYLISQNFVEFRAPSIVGDDAEGGTEVFKFDYFYGNTASLATSPQLYKQIMVGVFEKVFTINNVFRAEKHSTTRHLNEYTSLDLEMGFIDGPEDVMKLETNILKYIVKNLKEKCTDEFRLLGVEFPLLGDGDMFPSMKLTDAQKLISESTGIDCTEELDLNPEHERWLSEYAKKEFNSDFIFITNYPRTKRPFYTMDHEELEGRVKCFDLLFKGVELISGGQREHRHDVLVEKMKWKGLDPEKFSFYLKAFKYGLPPHGGLGMGLERLTSRFLDIPNIKEATLFPRDINRIDKRLSE